MLGVIVPRMAPAGERGVQQRRVALDVTLALLSAETYQHLAGRRGWSRAQCKERLVEVLAQQLWGEEPAATKRSPRSAPKRPRSDG